MENASIRKRVRERQKSCEYYFKLTEQFKFQERGVSIGVCAQTVKGKRECAIIYSKDGECFSCKTFKVDIAKMENKHDEA